jgi:AcrR family transcriptional regulator
MDRKTAIADKARELFNARGVGSVSPRDIAEALGIAYGNLTYHYPKKEDLVLHLYLGMMEAHRALTAGFDPRTDLLKSLVLAPDATFDISMEYLFLFRDFAEIMRDFPAVAGMQRKTVSARKAALKGLFTALKAQKLFREDMDDGQVEYLMDLSGAMRTFFFMDRIEGDLKPGKRASLRREYVIFVNRLLFPYLTGKGSASYRKVLKEAGFLPETA